MKFTIKDKWFRIAGIAKRIKKLDPPPHWRFEVAGSLEQHPINKFHFIGEATSSNNQPGVNPSAQGEDLLAWIACFGEVVVDENGTARFILGTPPTISPW